MQSNVQNLACPNDRQAVAGGMRLCPHSLPPSNESAAMNRGDRKVSDGVGDVPGMAAEMLLIARNCLALSASGLAFMPCPWGGKPSTVKALTLSGPAFA